MRRCASATGWPCWPPGAASSSTARRPTSPFVAGFVGAGRTLRRLDLLAATDALAPSGPTPGARGPAVGPTATLADVMAALLTSDAAAVRVVDDGSARGIVTLD